MAEPDLNLYCCFLCVSNNILVHTHTKYGFWSYYMCFFLTFEKKNKLHVVVPIKCLFHVWSNLILPSIIMLEVFKKNIDISLSFCSGLWCMPKTTFIFGRYYKDLITKGNLSSITIKQIIIHCMSKYPNTQIHRVSFIFPFTQPVKPVNKKKTKLIIIP